MQPSISNIPYHKKFEKVLNDGNRQAVDTAFEEFCSLELDEAYRRLWYLTCDEKAIAATLNRMGLESWPRENLELLRNELRYQYAKAHKGCFSTKKVLENWLVAYKDLVKQTDPIIARAVLRRCKITLWMDKRIVHRVLNLLGSEEPENYGGGLRQLGFSYEEVCYLKESRKYVRKLLMAMKS